MSRKPITLTASTSCPTLDKCLTNLKQTAGYRKVTQCSHVWTAKNSPLLGMEEGEWEETEERPLDMISTWFIDGWKQDMEPHSYVQ